MTDVTRILWQMESGDPSAAEKLLPLIYDELRKLAAARLAQEKPGQTLQATALVHDAYLRLVGHQGASDPRSPGWNGRGHFFGAAAEAMRRILVEQARRKQRVRHGGGHQRVDLNGQIQISQEGDDRLVALDEALQHLEGDDPAAAAVVKLRYFAGLTIDEAAQTLNISVRTANRHWAYARAWLYQRLS